MSDQVLELQLTQVVHRQDKENKREKEKLLLF
jgi:hypothetical protein